MTRVLFREYYDKSVITVEGHSGFDERGKDIVCAGISTLLCTLINCLRDEESAGRIKLLRDIVRDGYICFEIEYFDYAKERTKAITETCVSGLYMLSEQYPEYLHFE